MARVTRRVRMLRVGADRAARREDRVVVEEPLEVRIGGEAFSVTMRTPGDDIDLVHGLLFSEGVITAAADIAVARYCDGVGPDGLNTYNVIDVQLADGVPPLEPGLRRNVLTNSACGLCGTTSVDRVVADRRFEPAATPISADLLQRGPELLRTAQPAFDRTGGVHAAGLLAADGTLMAVREDVGRHNAADKVIGHALRQQWLPAPESILVMSSRASFELVQKAVLAGLGALVAVSAPTSLAIDLAEESGLLLAAFVRGETMNVYTEIDRLRELPGVDAAQY
ncbi:MAG: formate dehydrogenase accessory sulfurtransferase FdhD [Propionibacteriaceae bacterium]